MKRLFLISLMTILLFGCGDGGDNHSEGEQNDTNDSLEAQAENTDNNDEETKSMSIENTNPENSDLELERKGSLDEADVAKVYTNPLEYRGFEMSFEGIVFVDPERDSNGVYLQVFADPENHEKNTIVAIDDPDFDVEMDDYVHVEGVITDTFKGTNAFGGDVSAPVVVADMIEVVDYVDAISPTLETIEVDQSINQHGYDMHVDKVEMAENMTRLYITITNNTEDYIHFYSFDSRLLIDNKQLEEEFGFYEADFPELQSEILPGVETEGVIIFPPVDLDTDKMTFHAEGSSDNYDLDFKPFVFEFEK